jgi:fatty acid desaturase
MDKKASSGSSLNVGVILALALGIVLAIAFFGGIDKLWEVIKFLKQIPAWIYGILVVIFIFMRFKK